MYNAQAVSSRRRNAWFSPMRIMSAVGFAALVIGMCQAEAEEHRAWQKRWNETPTPAEIASKMKSVLSSLDHLQVQSTQTVSFVVADFESISKPDWTPEPMRAIKRPTTISASVRVLASMHPESFTAAFYKNTDTWRERPDVFLELAVKGGVPTLIEEKLVDGEYDTETYESPLPGGTDTLKKNSTEVLFEALPGTICATAEFFQTWVGDGSPAADTFASIVSDSVSIVMPEVFNGVDTFHLVRPVYNVIEDGHCSVREDHFWVDEQSFLLIGWRTELTDAVVGGNSVSYQVVERAYSYPSH